MVEAFESKPTHETPQSEAFHQIETYRETLERNKQLLADLKGDLLQTQTHLESLRQEINKNTSDPAALERFKNAAIRVAELQEILFQDEEVVAIMRDMGTHQAELNSMERTFRSRLM